MHDASLRTLADVVSFYDGGGRPNPHLDPGIRARVLSPTGRADLVSFLRSLTGTISEGH
jgi:cytochrome c peroxidase